MKVLGTVRNLARALVRCTHAMSLRSQFGSSLSNDIMSWSRRTGPSPKTVQLRMALKLSRTTVDQDVSRLNHSIPEVPDRFEKRGSERELVLWMGPPLPPIPQLSERVIEISRELATLGEVRATGRLDLDHHWMDLCRIASDPHEVWLKVAPNTLELALRKNDSIQARAYPRGSRCWHQVGGTDYFREIPEPHAPQGHCREDLSTAGAATASTPPNGSAAACSVQVGSVSIDSVLHDDHASRPSDRYASAGR